MAQNIEATRIPVEPQPTSSKKQIKVYLKKENLQLTSKSLSIETKTYSIIHLVSVDKMVKKGDKQTYGALGLIIGFTIGISIIFSGYSITIGSLIILAIFCIVGWFIGRLFASSNYAVQLRFSSGEVQQITLKDEEQLDNLASVIIRAMMENQ